MVRWDFRKNRAKPKLRPKSATVFNIGYTEEMAPRSNPRRFRATPDATSRVGR